MQIDHPNEATQATNIRVLYPSRSSSITSGFFDIAYRTMPKGCGNSEWSRFIKAPFLLDPKIPECNIPPCSVTVDAKPTDVKGCPDEMKGVGCTDYHLNDVRVEVWVLCWRHANEDLTDFH